MTRFIGRDAELRSFEGILDRIRSTGDGVLLSVRGRRQVGKSRLLEEFLARADVPSLFFAAGRNAPPAQELTDFTLAAASSTLVGAELFSAARPESWAAALRLLAAAIDRPSVVVLDELPYLLTADPSLEGTLQTVWDRVLSRVPLLLVVVGSDLSVMELLGSYDRPLYGRAREMVVGPLGVAETAELLHLDAADALDAHLICGGLPRLLLEWGPGRSRERFLAEQLADATSPLVVVGERVLSGELPVELQARRVLTAIGAGEAAYTAIANRAGVTQPSLARTLQLLVNGKRLLRMERPLSGRRSRLTRYTVADPYLRFWLAFVGPGLEQVLRGRGELVAADVERRWLEYRGAAVEPLLRDLLARQLPDVRFGTGLHVGQWWDRSNQVDVVVADGPDSPAAVTAIGSVKWRERLPFDRRDQRALENARATVPGAQDAELVGFARAGAAADVTVPVLTATELVGL